jgi:CRISPR-associated protein Cmr2
VSVTIMDKSSEHILLLQVGPVQEFISQARSTRDGWSGSYLLSWLMAQAIVAMRRVSSEIKFIYPNLQDEAQPLVQFLERGASGMEAEKVITPNLPNVICAVLPATVDARVVSDAAERVFGMEGEWGHIARACQGFLLENRVALTNAQMDRWDFQVPRHWEVSWQLWPIHAKEELDGVRRSVPMLMGTAPSADGWKENYQAASHRLSARRNTRNFDAWERTVTCHKDYLSGREEVVADKGWLDRIRQSGKRTLRYLFRDADELGAVNLIKRLWHRAYLERERGLDYQHFKFISVLDVAAAPWRRAFADRLLSKDAPEELDAAFFSFHEAVQRAEHLLPDGLDTLHTRWDRRSVDGLLQEANVQIFSESTWELSRRDTPQDQEAAAEVLKRLDALHDAAEIGKPGQYFAVIAMDGDEMGRWISGDKTGGKITRDLHLELSRQLSGFAVNKAREIVDAAEGMLIYAGGDDALAVVPATAALDCARKLLHAFHELTLEGQPLTASVGIAIGHKKAPLQDMIKAAHEAEKRAKRAAHADAASRRGYGRDAVAVTLYKRSGDMVLWGCKRESSAWGLLDCYQENFRPPLGRPREKMPVTGRFPHRLAELLLPYGADAWIDASLAEIIQREFAYVVERQTRTGRNVLDREALRHLRQTLEEHARDFLDACCAPGSATPATVGDFLHLFTIEAFMSRQGD